MTQNVPSEREHSLDYRCMLYSTVGYKQSDQANIARGRASQPAWCCLCSLIVFCGMPSMSMAIPIPEMSTTSCLDGTFACARYISFSAAIAPILVMHQSDYPAWQWLHLINLQVFQALRFKC